MVQAGKHEEAELITRISPVAWRHINLRGTFEFQRRQRVVNIEELVRLLEQKLTWQQLQMTEEILA